MKITRKTLRNIILAEARRLHEVTETPEYMAMNYPNVDIGGSEEPEMEQEVSLADLGERVTINLKETLDSLRYVVSDIGGMVEHRESEEMGYEKKFINDHAALSHVLNLLEDAIGNMG